MHHYFIVFIRTKLRSEVSSLHQATPSFVSQRLSGASLSSFLCVLGLPDCGVYGRFFFARFCMRINRFNDGLNCLLEILELFPNCPMVVAQVRFGIKTSFAFGGDVKLL